jgi:(E)-4-hydroxy-3-methylbut-2-enyl-diphosphate synthase
MNQHKSKVVKVGPYKLGGDNPIRVQSMCDTDTRDVKATVKQILELEKNRCEIIRVAVPDMKAAKAIGAIKKQIHIPLVADIHFDYKLALECIKQGIDKIRINPGNIGSEEKVKAVVEACKKKKIPIRIGINGGSLEKDLLKKYGQTPEAAVESAMRHVRILEKLNFHDILISIKFSEVPPMIEAYRLLAQKVPYPLHLGVTHAGTPFIGTIKNAIGIGTLVEQGIGATLRVSLTGPLTEELRVGYAILESLEKREKRFEMISCPTCGRCEIDLISLAERTEKFLEKLNKPIKVAVMGCVVNGPGEAKECDIGIAGGHGKAVIFAKGKILKTVPEKDIFKTLEEEINRIVK